ncbi:MAG: 16S rRNA (adenine(1518)-N(6)/adenine(1519)-N(6))-dimethyltransferase RsmA [Aphanocapsa feldmannii 277cV]|uniref:Ribosomal RNA small subunit methyltransferase A n=1 Tax=Aphanocapsa feldmannii 277cV TaxID=2507553 RepID=A0A524RPS9_9CHRO|nr:MAG: 16S rRNA (adenine(1518)-N(6)/adenine(1519)-N(6))-dimethyltransferase RsmA [Aphanocapsa feldmannii 288cV]TGG93818.1 MAG: 16S rRNA (adenine(1518)-N(6)/adenine(1519)-N(6))-dimethyltransferase RsmA [Aphanocapsa feldmannii 277cV]
MPRRGPLDSARLKPHPPDSAAAPTGENEDPLILGLTTPVSAVAHRPRRRFAQHWLRDGVVLDRIVEAAGLCRDDVVLEVGPGRGALTQRLLQAGVATVVALELDRDLITVLRRRFAPEPRLQLIQGDALALLRQPLPCPLPRQPNKVVANIPYNITGPLLEVLIGGLRNPRDPPFERLVVLLQKEVGDRITARPGHSDAGALSTRMQLLASCERICDVSPHCFKPAPKVMSEVIRLHPRALPAALRDPATMAMLDRLLGLAYGNRRKMLRSSLSCFPAEQLRTHASQAGIPLTARPQDLSLDQWVGLAAALAPTRS